MEDIKIGKSCFLPKGTYINEDNQEKNFFTEYELKEIVGIALVRIG